MGGGDLNLKKSWHPQTIRNVEKVWKAEQKAEAEAKKIEQLRKELNDERAREEMQRYAVEQGIARKKGERLDWMYSALGGEVDHELYLLGKPVDKAVDPMAQDNDEDSSAPGASFMNDTGANSANDLAAKIRDDPLFLIKRKEEEKRKELLKNPVKMKQLKLMLQANLEKSVKKKKKDKKKKSKQEKKERRKRRESHSESSKESVDEVRETMKENKRRQLEQDEEVYNASRRNHHRESHRSSEKRRHRRRSHSGSPISREDRKRREDRRYRHNSSSSPAKKKRHRSHSPSYSPPRKAGKSPPSRRVQSWKDRGSAVTKAMDASEKEKRLAAMMENAKWRDEQRGRNIKRYREEDAKLEAKDAIDAEKSAEFLVDLKVQSFSSKSTSSVSDRIRRNINSVQRTPAALEAFLAK